jgi:hypothetical protein
MSRRGAVTGGPDTMSEPKAAPKIRATLFEAVWDLWPILIPFVIVGSAIIYFKEFAP